METEKNEIKAARHYFDSCRAAFRLLQGALLSGDHPADLTERKRLFDRFLQLEERAIGDKKRVVDFFAQLPPVSAEEVKAAKRKQNSTLGNKKLIVIDDHFRDAGWEETLEFIYGVDAIEGFEDVRDFEKYIKSEPSAQKRKIFSILIDIDLSGDPNGGRDGIEVIADLSKRYPSYPLIAFSSYDSVVWTKRAFRYGAWDYFAKDPDEKESGEYRTALDYFQHFGGILDKYRKYHSEYASLYAKILQLQHKLRLYKAGTKLFKTHTLDSIWMAYRYLTIDVVTPFSPWFFKAGKHEEVVHQLIKAFEAFLVCILDANGRAPQRSRYAVGHLANEFRKYRGSHAIDLHHTEIRRFVEIRNESAHRYRVIGGRFAANSHLIRAADAKRHFDTALNLMSGIIDAENGY